MPTKDKKLLYELQRKHRNRNKAAVRRFLEGHPCVDCNNTDIRVLEFDHVRGVKLFKLAALANKCISLGRIWAEIEKCEVRCANCHRIKTLERTGNGRPRSSME